MWWNLDRNRLTGDLLQNALGMSFPQICMEVYAHHARAVGRDSASVLGDKNPTYTLFVNQLARLFPGARFVCLVRDYRDNILSFQQVGFDLQRTSALAARWSAFHRAILRYRRELADRFLVVRYEDLLCRPEAEIARICSFLEVPFVPAMLEHYTQRGLPISWNEKTKLPIDPQAVFRWRSTMAASEVAIADSICGRIGAEFGYDANRGALDAAMFAKTALGCAEGTLANLLERLFFRLPIRVRTRILNSYRRRSGTLQSASGRSNPVDGN